MLRPTKHYTTMNVELAKAKSLDKLLRAKFSIALISWHSGDKITPLKTFEVLSGIHKGIIPEHKYMFTDFGIDLRKNKLPKLAALHFKRAVELGPEDINAHFNVARIYYEIGLLERSEAHLQQALSITPSFDIAIKFLGLIHDQKKYA